MGNWEEKCPGTPGEHPSLRALSCRRCFPPRYFSNVSDSNYVVFFRTHSVSQLIVPACDAVELSACIYCLPKRKPKSYSGGPGKEGKEGATGDSRFPWEPPYQHSWGLQVQGHGNNSTRAIARGQQGNRCHRGSRKLSPAAWIKGAEPQRQGS